MKYFDIYDSNTINDLIELYDYFQNNIQNYLTLN